MSDSEEEAAPVERSEREGEEPGEGEAPPEGELEEEEARANLLRSYQRCALVRARERNVVMVSMTGTGKGEGWDAGQESIHRLSQRTRMCHRQDASRLELTA